MESSVKGPERRQRAVQARSRSYRGQDAAPRRRHVRVLERFGRAGTDRADGAGRPARQRAYQAGIDGTELRGVVPLRLRIVSVDSDGELVTSMHGGTVEVRGIRVGIAGCCGCCGWMLVARGTISDRRLVFFVGHDCSVQLPSHLGSARGG